MLDKLPKIEPLSDDAMHLNSDAPFPRALKDAAVLVPLALHKDQWHVLFIRRASNEQDRHSGQVAFPGGRLEESDASHEDAALRETHEEIGIPADKIKLLGKITPYVTCLLYTSPSPRDKRQSRMPSSA